MQAFARKSGQKHPFNTSFGHQAWTPEFRIAQKCLLAPPVFRSDSWAEPFKDKHDVLRAVLSSLHKSDSKKVLLRLEHEAASWLEPCQRACFSGKQLRIERDLSSPRLCHVGRGIWNSPESAERLHQKLGWLVLVQAGVMLAGRGMTDCTLGKPASMEWLHRKLGWHILVQVAPNCPGLAWHATMLQSLFLALPRHFTVGLWTWFQFQTVASREKPYTAPLMQTAWFDNLTLCT